MAAIDRATPSVPQFFDPNQAGKLWRVNYQQRAADAGEWARKYGLASAATDRPRICLMLIDVQNTFCLPDFELFVGGRSGTGAIDDNVRICEFIYRNLSRITEIDATMDTHTAMQIFHPVFWIDNAGTHPTPFTNITSNDVKNGKWNVNPAIVHSIGVGGENYQALQQHALHYVQRLQTDGKYPLTIWPYHAMLGGLGHALVPAIEEACFFHNMARNSQTGIELKGGNPLTENYSVLRPEVLDGLDGRPIAKKNTRFMKKLLGFDRIVIAGQAKSHCVAWTIDDLLTEILEQDPQLAKKVYLLEDCTSPVVVPGVVDFTDAAFKRFARAGMRVVKSTDAMD